MVPVKLSLCNLATLHRFNLWGWRVDHRRVRTWMGVIDTLTGRCDQRPEIVYLGVAHATA
jgi:hypothetical protein